MMNKEEQEAEIQARVNFKMNEFLTAVSNHVNLNWHASLQTNNPRYLHYNEALKQMTALFRKEMELPVPFERMHDTNRSIKRDKAVENIMEKLDARGGKVTMHVRCLERFLADEIGKAQRF